MATPRQLARPPITEALIDIRIAADPDVTASRLEPLRSSLASAYPKVEEKRRFSADVRFEGGRVLTSPKIDMGFAGLFFSTDDGKRIAQFRSDGFTLNQLGTYPGADILIAETLRLWSLYNALVSAVSVTRVAFRYINLLSLPLRDGDDFGRFLTAAPPMPEGTPQQVSSFLSRVVAHEDSDVAIVTQKLERSEGEKRPSVTIDIDVFVPGQFAPTEPALGEILGRLRILKNRLFFALLTDETVDLFV